MTRLLGAAGLIYLAFFNGASWGLEWDGAAIGLGVLPAAVIAFGLGARRYASGPVRFTGSAGTTANCLLIIGLAVNPYTAGGAALFYGTTLLVAAWRGQPGCEATVVSNVILGRDDQLGCQSSHRSTRLRDGYTQDGPRVGGSRNPRRLRRTTRSAQREMPILQPGDPRLDGSAAS